MPYSLLRRAPVFCAAMLASCAGRPSNSPPAPPPTSEAAETRLLVPPPAEPPAVVNVVADDQLLVDQGLQRESGGPVEVVRAPAGTDTRDLLDRGVDLLITNDLATLAYAATLRGFRSIPLDWDRTYILVSQTVPIIGDAQRAELARDAVRAEARPAEPPYWWDEGVCMPAATAQPRGAAARIVYARGDSVARDLAARLVAQRIGGTVILGMSPEEFASSLHSGREAAYVLSLPRRPPQDCHAVPSRPAGTSVTPLIETRRRAIVREGIVGLSVEADGRLRVRLR